MSDPITHVDEASQAWASMVDMAPETVPWAVTLRMSTVPMEYWFYKRKRLRPEDLDLELSIPSYGLWRATLRRHDGLFLAQWRPNGNFSVESQQLKYKRLIPLPALQSPQGFPALVGALEKALSVPFIRHTNLGPNGTVDVERWVAEPHPALQHWLAPCADTLGVYLRSVQDEDDG